MANLTVSRVLEIIDKAVDAWLKEQGTETDIVQRVKGQLNKSLENLTLYALGIGRDNFNRNRVEVETRSPGYTVLKSKIEDAAKAWLEENFETIKPQLTSQQIIDLKRHFVREYEQYLSRALSQKAEEKANTDATLIVDRIGLTTDKMRDSLKDLIREEEVAEAATEAARGKEFMKRTKLKVAEIRGVVAYDGEKLSDLIQEPDAHCWHVVQLQSVFGDMDCHILTNGQEWHPLNPSFTKGELDCASSMVLESFTFSKQMIFNFLDEADRLFIAAAIARHYQKNGGGDEGEIPF